MKCHYEGHVCECEGEIKNRHAMTAYVWDGQGEDPNADFMACDRHYEQYAEFWQEQWDEYYGIVREGIRGAQADRDAWARQRAEEDENRPSLQEEMEAFVSFGLDLMGRKR